MIMLMMGFINCLILCLMFFLRIIIHVMVSLIDIVFGVLILIVSLMSGDKINRMMDNINYRWFNKRSWINKGTSFNKRSWYYKLSYYLRRWTILKKNQFITWWRQGIRKMRGLSNDINVSVDHKKEDNKC